MSLWSMNRMRSTSKTLLPQEVVILDAAIAAGRDLGLHWEWVEKNSQSGKSHADLRMRLGLGKKKIDYLAVVKRGLRPAMLGAVLDQLTALGGKALLVADYITPPLADTLRTRGVQFIDTAGNAYLEKFPLLVWVKGQRPAEISLGSKSAGRVFQPMGLRVVFSLLCQPELADRPYRDLARHAGVAHGTVGWVMPELMALGYLTTVNGKRRLLNTDALLRQWVEAYARTLRPRLMLGRYQADTLDWTTDFDAKKYHLLLGGEPAAQALTGQLRPGTATFYGEKIEHRLLLDHRLRADPNGNVEFMKEFWTFNAERPGLAPMILIYADLLAIGDDRCLEAARQLYERIVNQFI